MDYPVKIFGKKHRVFFHDPISALMVGFICDGKYGAISALIHILTDTYCSKYPMLKKILEYSL